ncbi:glycosyltransferase [Roseomonas sp. CCTCC AB2023176]|uniref:glycosyltransferase n=1 Tax=Roseomonas sp. CCTCC AB2023176 TaxID=3342640 RepID=UPI0035E01F83
MIQVAQVTRSDLMGGRFTGFSVRHLLAERGIESRHLVFDPLSDDPAVTRILDYPGSRRFVAAASRAEYRRGHHALFQAHSLGLPAHRAFRRADVVHYHVIHDGFFSIAALPLLTRLKPSVWTWHDPWIMTGHCMHPIECGRWRTGCGACPDLRRPFEMAFDNTARSFAVKRRIVNATRADIVLASRWMMRMAEASPMARGARLHHVPFGVDLSRFAPRDPAPARAALGIRPDDVVVAVRGFGSPLKGTAELVQALEAVTAPITLLLMQDDGAFDRLIGRHRIVSLDWSNDEEALIRAYAAADLFAMPSTGEAFGMMAVEAMACGKPVVVFEGTALPEVTFAPECGIAVPLRDVAALAAAVQYLATDEADRLARGRRARELAERHYSADLYADRLADLYRAKARRDDTGERAAPMDAAA